MWADIVKNNGKAKASGNDSGIKALKKAETYDEGWTHGEYRKFSFSTPKQVRYKIIIDENGIEKCIRDDGCIGILVGYSTYVSNYFTYPQEKKKKRERNILLFSPKIVYCLLHPGSSDYEKAIMLHEVFLKYYPEMMKKPDELTEHFGYLLPYGLVSQKLVDYEEGMEIRKYERVTDDAIYKWTFKLDIGIEWIPKGKRFKIIDFEGDCLITEDNFLTA